MITLHYELDAQQRTAYRKYGFKFFKDYKFYDLPFLELLYTTEDIHLQSTEIILTMQFALPKRLAFVKDIWNRKDWDTFDELREQEPEFLEHGYKEENQYVR